MVSTCLHARRIISSFLVPFSAMALCAVPAYADESDTAQKAFEIAADTLFDDIMNSSPVNLHYSLSFPDSYALQDSAMLGGLCDSLAETEEIALRARENLSAVSYNELTAKQKQVYQAMNYFIDLNLSYCSLPDYFNTLGPMGGILSAVDTVVTEYYLLSEQDVQDYCTLLQDIPRFLQEILGELEAQEAIGFSASRYALEEALSSREHMTALEQHPYLEAFLSNVKEAGLSAEALDYYTKQVTSILSDQVLPAFSSFYAALDEKTNAAGESRGLCTYDRGAEYYELLVKDQTGTDMTPLQLKDYLMDKLDEEMADLTTAFLSHPNLMTEMYSLNPPETDTEAIVETLKKKSAETMPQIEIPEYTLSYLPEALEIPNTLAYYLSAPIDNTGRNVIRLNRSELGEDSMLLWTTLAHESFPGHLYQHQYFLQNSMAYNIETLIESIGTSEGWAYYVERLSLDWAGVDSVLADAYFSDQISGMTIMSIADIGINYEGWGLAEIADFLSEYYGEQSADVYQNFLDTCANDPGVFLPYSVGYYQTKDLFDAISDSYSSDQAMYKAYLNLGALPFTLLERYLIPDGSI